MAVAKVVAQPDEQEIKNGQTYNLTASDELAFLVTVENQGNMAEKDVPVVVTLAHRKRRTAEDHGDHPRAQARGQR